ncbi:MAG: 3-deoxy-D-manno-octulosonic acid transferase [Bacteroidales bacterium]|jgi:3-deoxy-D-manno-octulosonic-acid transferase|nr:3-deoxy-D-manno-octulosonic acid transferase [Bacteroidales bacterium]
MAVIYSIGIYIYYLLIKISSLSNDKARLWIRGRKNWKKRLSDDIVKDKQNVWFHCASLGEFEQGRPLIEAYKNKYPDRKIVLTFFSPSGYEVRKNYDGADYIYYLPLDTKRNARAFIDIIKPVEVFFVKYEYWNFYFKELKKRETPLYMVSAIFRQKQMFFKSYGGWYRGILKCVKYFFVQEEGSEHLLKSIGFTNSTITGDTRFDRVYQIAGNAKDNDIVESFVRDSSFTVVLGSSWEKDEVIVKEMINSDQYNHVKFVVAPHHVDRKNVLRIKHLFGENDTVMYSETDVQDVSNYRFLVIDCIGLLSSLYKYGNIAYIGGGFGVGIHNILEAATFGLPVVFGPNHKRFKEANDLKELKGAFGITNADDLNAVMSKFVENEKYLEQTSDIARKYILEKLGAVSAIINTI